MTKVNSVGSCICKDGEYSLAYMIRPICVSATYGEGERRDREREGEGGGERRGKERGRERGRGEMLLY